MSAELHHLELKDLNGQDDQCTSPIKEHASLGLYFKTASLIFDKFIRFQLILRHHVFNESEAAEYCRTSVESIRYHALRSRKLAYLKFSKEGLVFLKKDLDSFLNAARVEGFRDHS